MRIFGSVSRSETHAISHTFFTQLQIHATATQLADGATNNNHCENVSSRHDPINSGITTIIDVTRTGHYASVRRDLSAMRFAANHKIVKIDAD